MKKLSLVLPLLLSMSCSDMINGIMIRSPESYKGWSKHKVVHSTTTHRRFLGQEIITVMVHNPKPKQILAEIRCTWYVGTRSSFAFKRRMTVPSWMSRKMEFAHMKTDYLGYGCVVYQVKKCTKDYCGSSKGLPGVY